MPASTDRARQSLWQALTGALMEPLSVLLMLTVILIQVVWLQQPLAPMLVALLLFHRGMGALFNMQTSWQSTMSKIGAVEAVETELEQLRQHRAADGSRVIGPLQREIRLDAVSFAYQADLGDALRAVSVSIPARSMIAIVGPSGASKSTLANPSVSLYLSSRDLHHPRAGKE